MLALSFVVLVLLAAGAPATARGEGALTLDQCYSMALTQSETVAIQEETICIAEAHYFRALGTVLPHVNVVATELLQQSGFSQQSGGLGSTAARMSTPQVALNYSQTLFQGLREFRALSMARSEKSKDEFTWVRAKQLLYSDVANAYFTVLETERQVSISESMRAALSQWMRELSERIALGKSRTSELLAVEAQKAAIEGNLASLHGLVNTSRDLLGFLVGREVRDRFVNLFQVPRNLGSVDRYLQDVSSRRAAGGEGGARDDVGG
jgi:outer membrane protein